MRRTPQRSGSNRLPKTLLAKKNRKWQKPAEHLFRQSLSRSLGTFFWNSVINRSDKDIHFPVTLHRNPIDVIRKLSNLSRSLRFSSILVVEGL
jgi:hypothetical protein